MLIPLAIINHFKPTRDLPGEKQLHELYPLGTEQSDFRLPRSERFLDLAQFLSALDDTFEDSCNRFGFARCAGARWKKRSAGCSSGSARGATGSRRSFRRC